MDMPRLGHAVIVNNVATEFPGSMADVEALHNVYHQMGLEVQVYKDCDQNVSDVTLPLVTSCTSNVLHTSFSQKCVRLTV